LVALPLEVRPVTTRHLLQLCEFGLQRFDLGTCWALLN